MVSSHGKFSITNSLLTLTMQNPLILTIASYRSVNFREVLQNPRKHCFLGFFFCVFLLERCGGGPYSGAICSPLPAKPCGTVLGSKIFTQIPRRRLPPAGFSAARFAPHPPQSFAAPFRGAKSSHRFRAAACLRRLFQRRDLLPAPRKALRLRHGEQNLHINSAPPPATGGLFSGAICSPPPAKPFGSVPGSKIFTQIPRRHLPPAAFLAARFAPRSPQSLAAPSRGAKSSQRFRAASRGRPASSG